MDPEELRKNIFNEIQCATCQKRKECLNFALEVYPTSCEKYESDFSSLDLAEEGYRQYPEPTWIENLQPDLWTYTTGNSSDIQWVSTSDNSNVWKIKLD